MIPNIENVHYNKNYHVILFNPVKQVYVSSFYRGETKI